MYPTKAPGQDEFNSRFFQIWLVIGGDITTAMLGMLNNGDGMEKWNETLICLIPKVGGWLSPLEFMQRYI